MNIRQATSDFDGQHAGPAIMPVKLCRARQTMLLFVGPLADPLCASLKGAGFLVGGALPVGALDGAAAIDNFDYLFWGRSTDPGRLMAMAIGDCRRSGWRVAM
jgi:hypothetical protein